MTHTAPVSPYLELPKRSEAEVRASLISNLRSEGASSETIGRFTTDEHVKRMAAYERECVDEIAKLFGGAR